MKHLSMEELEAGLENIRQAPQDDGEIRGIVIRPSVDEREDLDECKLSPDGGAHGDRWAKQDPAHLRAADMQIAVMSARAADLVSAGDRSRWPLAGDNLFVDLDLSASNLAPGQRLAAGSVEFEVTAEPHDGCPKFAKRFGRDAVMFVNTPAGRDLHLRGVYFRVVRAGTVKVGDRITKIPADRA